MFEPALLVLSGRCGTGWHPKRHASYEKRENGLVVDWIGFAIVGVGREFSFTSDFYLADIKRKGVMLFR